MTNASKKSATHAKHVKKRRALVTGAAGFGGSHLVDLLVAEGHEVIATVSAQDSPENLKHHKSAITRRTLDITDKQAVNRVIKDTKPNWIFHLAAFSSVGRSFANEALTYRVNTLGSLNIIEAAEELRSKVTRSALIYCTLISQ